MSPRSIVVWLDASSGQPRGIKGAFLTGPHGQKLEAVEYVPADQLAGVVEERDEAIRLLANATDPSNESDWSEAREVGWEWVRPRVDTGGQS